MNFNSVYVSSNCNQTPTAADCNENDLIAYGSCNAVLIYNPTVSTSLSAENLSELAVTVRSGHKHFGGP